jgi:hypothetical protein
LRIVPHADAEVIFSANYVSNSLVWPVHQGEQLRHRRYIWRPGWLSWGFAGPYEWSGYKWMQWWQRGGGSPWQHIILQKQNKNGAAEQTLERPESDSFT